MAPLDVVERVLSINPNNILVFWRGAEMVGSWSNLMLSSKGLEALVCKEFDPRCPTQFQLAGPSEVPAAIYVWAVVAPKTASEGITHVSRFLSQPLYGTSNLFARPMTKLGHQLSEALGFAPLKAIPDHWRYVRLANRIEPGEAHTLESWDN
jgi:hypothetical protein